MSQMITHLRQFGILWLRMLSAYACRLCFPPMLSAYSCRLCFPPIFLRIFLRITIFIRAARRPLRKSHCTASCFHAIGSRKSSRKLIGLLHLCISLILHDQTHCILRRIRQWAHIQHKQFHVVCTRCENTENGLGVRMRVHTDTRQWVDGVKDK